MGKMIMALKKLANKLNGKAPESDNVVGVINGIADDYEAPDLTPYATKVYVEGLMSGALKRAIVLTLPEEDIDTNTIYMVLDSEASQQGNVYNEYLYINEAWELIGTTAVSGITLYRHNIVLKYASRSIVMVTNAISKQETPYTADTFLDLLIEMGCTSANKTYLCSGILNNKALAYMWADNSNPKMYRLDDFDGDSTSGTFFPAEVSSFTDTVSEIQ